MPDMLPTLFRTNRPDSHAVVETARTLVADTLRVVLAQPVPSGPGPTAFESAYRVLQLVVPVGAVLLAFWLGYRQAQNRERREAYLRIYTRIAELSRTIGRMRNVILKLFASAMHASRLIDENNDTTAWAFSHAMFRLARAPLRALIRTSDELEANANDIEREFEASAAHFPTLGKAVKEASSERRSLYASRIYLILARPERRPTKLTPVQERAEIDEELKKLDDSASELDRCYAELAYLFRRRAYGKPRRMVQDDAVGNPDMRILTEDGMKTATELGIYESK
jgi:hypothetical protein